MADFLSMIAGLFAKKSVAPVVAAAPVGQEVIAPIPAVRPGFRGIIVEADKGGVISRDKILAKHAIDGHMPSWMKFAPIHVGCKIQGKDRELVFFCMPDYILIGNDMDFSTVNMNYENAKAVADALDCILPTKQMVDHIYLMASYRLAPHPIPSDYGVIMQSTEFMAKSHAAIEAEKLYKQAPNGALVAGHKKDLVITPRLASNPGKEAIYGWHRYVGSVIQPLSLVHDIHYADYSHGARLISKTCKLDGIDTPIASVLADPSLCVLLSDEGPFKI